MTIIPAQSSVEKTCVKSLSSTCVFPWHFVMKFFKHTEKLKQFYSNIHVSTICILPLTSYFVTHLSICGVILFLDAFQRRFITAFLFVNKTHIETCKTAQSENNLTKKCLAFFEAILSELVKSIITLSCWHLAAFLFLFLAHPYEVQGSTWRADFLQCSLLFNCMHCLCVYGKCFLRLFWYLPLSSLMSCWGQELSVSQELPSWAFFQPV